LYDVNLISILNLKSL